jgi:hypothetical protein
MPTGEAKSTYAGPRPAAVTTGSIWRVSVCVRIAGRSGLGLIFVLSRCFLLAPRD